MENNTPKKLYGAHSLDNKGTCQLCTSVKQRNPFLCRMDLRRDTSKQARFAKTYL